MDLRFTTKENIERIADALEEIAKQSQSSQKLNIQGLSTLCKNAYNMNIRIDEVKDLIRELFERSKEDA